MFRYLFTAVSLFALITPALTQEDPLPIIIAADQQYDRAFDAHDAVSLTAFYTDDATIIAPSVKAVTGYPGILASCCESKFNKS